MTHTDHLYEDAPHPSFAVLKEKNGLEWWEWRRPEDGILQIQLTGKGFLTDEETDRLGGSFLTERNYEILASEESVDIYQPTVRSVTADFGVKTETLPEERLIVSFRKGGMGREVTDPAYAILRHAAGASKNRGLAAGIATAEGLGKDPSRFVSRGGATAGYLTEDGYLSKTSESNMVFSGIVGHFNSTPRNPYCRQTAFTRDRFEEFMAAMPLIERMSRSFQALVPTRWAKQRDFIQEKKLGEKGWVLGDTVFTTITVNRNYQTGTHKDAGDFHPGFGNLTVLEGGKDKYAGGNTCFPKFRIAVDLRTGDYLGADIHEWHGNTKLFSAEEGKDDWERISIVCYVRVKMADCGTVEQENEKYQKWLKTSFQNPAQRHENLIRTTEEGKVQRAEALSYLQFLLGDEASITDLPEEKTHLHVIEDDVDEDDKKKPEANSLSESCPHGRTEFNARAKDCRVCEATKIGCFAESSTGTKPKAVWIVGDPGAGKTTLVRALVGDAPLTLIPSPKWTTAGDRFVLAGHYTGATFDGADTINYNGAEEALDFWEKHLLSKEIAIFDGDRFSHAKALERISKVADPLVIHLVVSEAVAAERRKARGSNQNEAWVKGRRTKSARFAASFEEGNRLSLDASLPPEELAKKVLAWLSGEKVESFVSSNESESVTDLFA